MSGKIANTRHAFGFIIEIDGLNQYLVQKIQIPEEEIEVVAHGDTNHDVKTGGRYKIGDIVLDKLKALPTSDMWAKQWMNTVQNPTLGGGSLPLDYKKIVIIREMDTTGTIAVNSYIFEGCFPTKISHSDFDRNSSDNMIETVTLSTDRGRKI